MKLRVQKILLESGPYSESKFIILEVEPRLDGSTLAGCFLKKNELNFGLHFFSLSPYFLSEFFKFPFYNFLHVEQWLSTRFGA